MIVMTVLSPLRFISATIAAGPVTYALTPGGAGVCPTMCWTASTDSVAQGLALVTGEIQLNICGLTVGALRGAPGECITPEILDVLHMLRIVLQLTNQTIVVPVSIVAEGLLTLQDDHRHTAGIRFLEVLVHALVALKDCASVGFSDTECSFSTCSSAGTPILKMTMIANHAKMMGIENRWIVRATNGARSCS